MRTLLFTTLFMALFSVIPTGQTKAQAAGIIEDTWRGYAEFQADYLQGGVGSVTQTLTINVYSNMSISGTGKSAIDLNGTIYVCHFDISGRVYESTNQVYISTTNKPGADELPYGLRWCDSAGTLDLYSDSDRSGYYILDGKLTDNCNNSNINITLSNY